MILSLTGVGVGHIASRIHQFAFDGDLLMMLMLTLISKADKRGQQNGRKGECVNGFEFHFTSFDSKKFASLTFSVNSAEGGEPAASGKEIPNFCIR